MFLGRLINLLVSQQVFCAYISDISTSPKDRAKNFGLLGAGSAAALIIGPFAGGMAASYNLVYPLLIAGGITILNLAYITCFLSEHIQTSASIVKMSDGFALMLRMLKDPFWRLLLIIKLMVVMGSQDVNELFFLYVFVRFNLSTVDIGIFAAFIGIVHVVWKGVVLRWFVTYGSDSIYLPASSLSSCITHIGIGMVNFLPLLYILAGSSGMGLLAQIVIDSIISSKATVAEQGTILGIIGSTQTMAEVIGGSGVSLLFAAVVDENDLQSIAFGAPFFVGGAVNFVAFILWLVWFRLYYGEAL